LNASISKYSICANEEQEKFEPSRLARTSKIIKQANTSKRVVTKLITTYGQHPMFDTKITEIES
jgi:hypothetical protein